jgi:hypothetical protein
MIRPEADEWESKIKQGALVVGAHVDTDTIARALDVINTSGAARIATLNWPD